MNRLLKKYYRIIRSIIGSIIYGFPSSKLKLIGVTGTSGKSTTATLIYHILKENGFKVGVVSTVGAIAGDKKIDTGFHVTTPDPIQMQRILRMMVDEGVEYVIIEASSHAIEQGRIGLLKFIFAVFTNIKRDHLDYHKDWKSYAGAKAELIRSLKRSGVALINKDDVESYEFLKQKVHEAKAESVEYSVKEQVTDVRETKESIQFVAYDMQFVVPIIGFYNVDNSLAAINVARGLGLNPEEIALALASFEGLEGRMQVMQKDPFMVIVDFAHNTDSLERSLTAARELVQEGGKLITVFGSAGLRDIEKRFTMGETAAKFADIVIITAEDPRIERLYDINSRIIEGAENSGGKLIKRIQNHEAYQALDNKFFNLASSLKPPASIFVFDEESVNSRFDAIGFAIKIASPGDVVITEGKGHEQSLCFGTIEYPFTDQEAVKKALEI